VSNPEVAAIILHVDSPGGTASGTSDLANEIRDASRSKPVWAFIEDLSASAAYWVASAAQRVVANDVSALIGSIGTYQIIHDSSEMANQLGVKVHVIRAGDLKGVGTPGTEVTESHLQEFQRIVNSVNESFLSGVSQGRRMTIQRVMELADGRLFTANEALDHKLIDAVQTWDQTISELSTQSQQRSKGTKTMTSTPESPATLSQLRQFCAGADDTFLLEQIEKQSKLSEALTSWTVKQQETIDAMKNDLKESQTLATVETSAEPLSPLRTIGVTTFSHDSGSPWDNDDAKSAFDREVRSRLRPGASMQERHAAIAYVARTQPAVHQASIAADNPSKKSRRMLEEKYESSDAK
jgi:signal peptide peptidase SppA